MPISDLPVPQTGAIQDLPVPQGSPVVSPEQADIDAFTATAGPLRRGMRSAWNGIGASLNGIIASTGEALGMTEFANDRFAEAKRFTNFAESVDHEVRDYGAVKDFNSLIDYVAGNVGKGVVSSLPSIALAVGLRRPVAGVVGGAFPQEAGEQALTLRDNPNIMASTTPGQRLANAATKGAINSVLELGGVEGQAARRLLKPGSASKGLVKSVAKATVGEGLTEAAQETVGQGLEQQLDPSKKIDPHQVINAGLAGAVGGGAVGGIAHGISALPGAAARTVDELQDKLGKLRKPIDPDPEAIPEEATKLDTKEQVLEFLSKMDDKWQETYSKMKDPAEREAFYNKAKEVYYDSGIRPHVNKVIDAGKAVRDFAKEKLKKSEMENNDFMARRQKQLLEELKQKWNYVPESTEKAKYKPTSQDMVGYNNKLEEYEGLKNFVDRFAGDKESGFYKLREQRLTAIRNSLRIYHEQFGVSPVREVKRFSEMENKRGPEDDDILDFMSGEMDQDARNSSSPEQLQSLQKLVRDVVDNPSEFKHVHRSLKKVFGDKFEKITDYAIERTNSEDGAMRAKKRELKLAMMPQDDLEKHRGELASNILRTYSKPDYSVNPEMRKAMLDEMGPRILDWLEEGHSDVYSGERGASRTGIPLAKGGGVVLTGERKPELKRGEADKRFIEAMKEATGPNFDKAMNELEQLKDIQSVTSDEAFEGEQDERLAKVYDSPETAEIAAEAMRDEFKRNARFSVHEAGELGTPGAGKYIITMEDQDTTGFTRGELARAREPAKFGASGTDKGIVLAKGDQKKGFTKTGVKINIRNMTHMMMQQEGQQTQEGGVKYVADMFSRGMSKLMSTDGFEGLTGSGDNQTLPQDKKGNWILPDNTPVATMEGKTYTFGDIRRVAYGQSSRAQGLRAEIRFAKTKEERSAAIKALSDYYDYVGDEADRVAKIEEDAMEDLHDGGTEVLPELIDEVTEMAADAKPSLARRLERTIENLEREAEKMEVSEQENSVDDPNYRDRQNKQLRRKHYEEDTGEPIGTGGAPGMSTPEDKGLEPPKKQPDSHLNKADPIPENEDLLEKNYGLAKNQRISDDELMGDVAKRVDEANIGSQVVGDAAQRIVDAMYPGIKKKYSLMETKSTDYAENVREYKLFQQAQKEIGEPTNGEDANKLARLAELVSVTLEGHNEQIRNNINPLAQKRIAKATEEYNAAYDKARSEAEPYTIEPAGDDQFAKRRAAAFETAYREHEDAVDSMRKLLHEFQQLNEAWYAGNAVKKSEMGNKTVSTEEFNAQLNKKYHYGVKIKLNDYGDSIELDTLHVQADMRGQGLGSRIMQDIIIYADKVGKGIFLNAVPTKTDETTLEQLEKFYARFGFRAFDEADRAAPGQKTEMYRDPVKDIDETSRRYDTTGAEGSVGENVSDIQGEVREQGTKFSRQRNKVEGLPVPESEMWVYGNIEKRQGATIVTNVTHIERPAPPGQDGVEKPTNKVYWHTETKDGYAEGWSATKEKAIQEMSEYSDWNKLPAYKEPRFTGKKAGPIDFDDTPFSTMNVGSGDATPEQQQAAKDYVKRVLGDKAEVIFEKLAHAGEFARINDIETLKIAINAIDPQSVAYHEALHAFFERLVKADKKAANTLLRAAGSAPIVARLRQLLKDHPKALKQLEDPEERLAYMYQFAAAGEKGLIQIGPETKTLFGQVKKFFRQIGAIWSDEMADATAVEKTAEILDAFHEGKFANRSTVAEVLHDRFPADLEEKMRKIAPALGKFVDKFIYTANEVIRDTSDPALMKIANQFHTPTEGGEPGFLQTRHTTFNRFMNQVNDALKSMNNEQLRNVMIELQAGEPTSEAGKKIRRVLDQAYDYLEKSGVKRFAQNPDGSVKYKKGTGTPELEDIGFIENYFPRVPDSDYLRGHQKEFIELLRQHNIQDPEKVYEKYAQNIDEGSPREEDYVVGLAYYTPSTGKRTLNDIPDSELAPFLAKDIVGVLSQYLSRAARRGEYTKRFGNSGEKIDEAVEKADITPEQKKSVEEAVRAMEGTLGANMSKELKAVYGALTTYQNIRLLPLALFSSFVDPLGIVVRGGTVAEGGKAFIRGIRELAGFKDDDAYQLAATIGAINTANDAQVIGDMYSSQFMPTIQKRINDKFFKYIGMESFNRSMRVAASAAAEQFLIRHGTKPTKDSERYLTELGLTKDDISIVNDKLVLNEKVVKALNLWVDQAILRPNAALRPVYMSDPNWILISHLKQYTYMFQKVIISRVHHELQHGNYTPLYGLMGYVPLIIASDMLRAGLTPGRGDDHPEWDVADWLWRGVQRAGFFGPGQFAIDSANDFSMSHFGIESIIGPTGQQLLDFVRASLSGQGLGNEAIKAIPGARLFK